ncbi:MAG: hypothetical protein GY816_07055 [Cytophagales bacterium]|nr:hypothetical protein [Cytophagales bacterium]
MPQRMEFLLLNLSTMAPDTAYSWDLQSYQSHLAPPLEVLPQYSQPTLADLSPDGRAARGGVSLVEQEEESQFVIEKFALKSNTVKAKIKEAEKYAIHFDGIWGLLMTLCV